MSLMKIFLPFFIFSYLLFNTAAASPREIILIRHAAKLMQSDPGDTLSAKGQIRAINFAFYFINKFGSPDFIFASDPKDSKSIRQIQTVSPLANILTEKNNREVSILHPYESSEYEKLADEILKDAKFDNRIILICWDHEHLPAFAKKLGVKIDLPDWPSDDFESVYILEYNSNNKLINFSILHQQYPVNVDMSWEDLYKKINVPFYLIPQKRS